MDLIKRWSWFLILVFVTGFLVRYMNIMSLSSGHDHAFLIYWSRIVSEACELGPYGNIINSLMHGSREQAISLLVTHQDSLLYAMLYGLYENPEKISRIIDVIILAVWFKLVGYGILQARVFSVLFQLGTVWITYLLALRISRSHSIAFLSLLLMTFLPMNVLFSRFVSWHTFGSFFFILTIYIMLIGFDKKAREGRCFLFYLSSILWGIAALSNTLIPFLLPLIVGGYLWIVVEDSVKEKIKIFFSWLWPGLIVLLPAFVFLIIRFQEFYQRNIGYDYWNQSLYEKVVVQIASWKDIASLPLMICALLGGVLALKKVRDNEALSILLLWLFFQFFLFSFISSEMLLRVHLNVLPPLVFLASFFAVSSFSWIERRSLVASKKIYLRIGMVTILLLVVLPSAVTLCKVLRDPYYNPLKYGNYRSYLHPLRAEVELVGYIEEKLPSGSIIFVSSNTIHSMNVHLSRRRACTFVNVTALFLNHRGKDYKYHLKRFYPRYQEETPHYIVTKHSVIPLEYFKALEPSAQFRSVVKTQGYELFRIELPSSSEEKGRAL